MLQNTPISLGKSKPYSKFRNANPEKQEHIFWSLFIFRRPKHGNMHQYSGATCRVNLFCGPTQEPVLATANTGKTQERFGEKMQVNGPGG